MFNLLEQLNIEFINEYSPEWIGRKRYDFYIQSMNLIIEMDGGFHTKDNLMNGQTKEESKAIDDYKDIKAKEHGIEVIRIDCNYHQSSSRLEYIKQNILNSKLNTLFDLKIINWNIINEFAISSYVKKICEYKRDNPELTTGDIGIVFNMDRHKVLKYIRQGSEIWDWINYDSSMRISNKSKKVEVFKDNISLGIFNSIKELHDKSKDLFGIRFPQTGISNVCNGKKEQYKEHIFKFV